jgi:type IV pilus assembly protein PilF
VKKSALLWSSILLTTLLGAGCVTKTEKVRAPGELETSTPSGGEAAAQVNVQLGLGYLEKGNVQRAKRKLMLALEQSPKLTEANGAMAYFYEVTQDNKQAEQYYRRAIDVASTKGAAYNNYGAYLCRHKRFDDAKKQFMKAVADNSYLNPADAYENAGLCELQNNELKEAKLHFEAAMAQDPRRTTSLLGLGELALRQKDYNTTSVMLEKYEKLAAMDASASWLAYRLNRDSGHPIIAQRYAHLLRDEFPTSQEAALLKKVG